MTLFNRSKPSTVDDGPALPAGFDDPESDTFVPEALRPYWRDNLSNPAALPAVIDERIELEAREAAEALQRADWEANRTIGNTGRRGEFVFDGREYATFPIADEIRRIRKSPDDLARIQALAIHALHVADAKAAAAAAASTAARVAQDTCPVCGDRPPHAGAPVVRPRAFRGRSGREFRMTCCRECANAVDVVHAEWLRTHVVRDGKTRVQLVTEALANR
ncbi:hypothetical protein MUN74_07185 [Agromyces endophyticus]|uniref:hypothetical protein n=1 Tax=Agromyces sp. H17E-10 TaxID=2932244 RepID=UPI001FCFBEDC|nr:hypothetical protein [Agromyces sp. H17E-10]UOQ90686.1 hypothetical protein MUN74_07185 [Agromyces sp. H17E-10]